MSYFIITLCIASPNFATDDVQLANAAEAARFRSALFWTNKPLAGNWSDPCPITIEARNAPAGGVTRFVFDRGEVFGWSMTLSGRRESIFGDALPHEVDHMVRATLIRRPILRWLDEGAAALFESPQEHARHRARAIEFARSGRAPTFLTAANYPTNASDVADLYAVGFSITEHLLERGTVKQLIALQASADPLDVSLQSTHRTTANLLVHSWRSALLADPTIDCAKAGCRIHQPLALSVACNLGNCRRPNTMLVWTAPWCNACQQFWNDYREDAQFRAAVDARVHIHHANADRHPLQARLNKVRSLPTFITSHGRLEGYRSKQRFLDRLVAIGGLNSRSTSSSDSGKQELAETPPLKTPSNSDPAVGDEQANSSLLEMIPKQTPPAPVDREVDPPTAIAAGETCPTPSRLYTLAGVTLTALEWFGLAGATTGPLGVALATLALIRKRRRRRSRTSRSPHLPTSPLSSRPQEGPPASTPRGPPTEPSPPFPRELDKARELLRLRQREGRVAALDAIRGMVVDDELDRLAAGGQPEFAEQLRQQLNDRVQQIAPIATSE